jgi:glycerol-3-phosphate O-acyltransferase / dihydroxyacetone phosphate acyltransferase
VRALADRVVRLIARAATLGWFRSVEASGLERVPASGPCLIVVNHPGGFVDPALLASVLPRPPRFLAMASLWRNPILRPLLALAGAIPVQRATEGPTDRNEDAFARCHAVLRAGGLVAIFPEGQASDEPHLLPVRTGAARIALGSRAPGLRIVPVGLIYEAKQRARQRALVRVGAPIVVEERPEGAERDRDAVAGLTAEIRRRLADASMDYEDATEAADLGFAAAVYLRRSGGSPTWSPSLGDLERIADRLADAPTEARDRVRTAAGDYRLALVANRTADRAVAAGSRPGRTHPTRLAADVLTIVALPLALVGLVANIVPAMLVHLAGRRPAAPVTLATVKFLTGLVAFPLTWWVLERTVFHAVSHPWLWTIAVGPICGLCTAVVADRVRRARLARLRPGRLIVPDRAAEDLLDRRAWLVEMVGQAVADDRGQGSISAGSLDVRP